MKVYDRKSKKWVEEDVVKAGSLKKPDTCKGKRPHNFILVLPEYIKTTTEITPEAVAKYYEIEEETHTLLVNQANKLAGIGIRSTGWNRKPTKYYRCDVCGKKDYIYPDKT